MTTKEKKYSFNLIYYFKHSTWKYASTSLIKSDFFELQLAADIYLPIIPIPTPEKINGQFQVEQLLGGNPAKYLPLPLGTPQIYANLQWNHSLNAYQFVKFVANKDYDFVQLDVNAIFANGFQTNAVIPEQFGLPLILKPTDKSTVYSVSRPQF